MRVCWKIISLLTPRCNMNDLFLWFPEDFEVKYLAYKAKFIDSEKLNTNTTELKKYSSIKEPIKISSLGVEICGNYIKKGDDKFRLNNTDRWLIYFLYYKSIENIDECFSLNRLTKEMESEMGIKKEVYIRNRISSINKGLKRLIVKGKTNIGDIVKNERGRGYHLNPKVTK